jgi:hypothetical protein
MDILNIELPPLARERIWNDIFSSIDEMIKDILLYLCYGIAILSGFKFIIYIVNGFASKSYMGAKSLDDTSLFR